MGAGWCWQGLGCQGHGDGTGTLRCPVELSTDLREVSQCLEKATTRAFALLKAPIGTLINKHVNVVKWT